MQQTRRSRVLSALAAAAFCAASAAALALPLTAAAAYGSAEVAEVVDTAASTRHDEPAGGCRGVEVSVRGEARVGSTLTATLAATVDDAATAALPDVSGDEPPAAEGAVTAIEPPEIEPAEIAPAETEAETETEAVDPAKLEPASIDSVVFEWFSEPAPVVRPTPSPVPTATATPVPTQTPTAVPTATPTPAPIPSPVPSPVPTATAGPTPTPSVAPTPRPTPDVEPPTPRGAEYVVPAADLGLVVRARAIVTRAGEPPVPCLSAPSEVVLAAAQPETPPLIPAPTAAEDAAVHGPDIASAAVWSRDDADTGDAGAIADPVAEAPAAASEPVVSVNISSDVLLIGGLAAIALIAAAAVFGRNES